MVLVHHVLRPAHPSTLLLVAVLAVLLTVAAHAGLFGLPLALITLSWLLKYAYVLLDSVAEGIDEPPVLSVEMVNPLEQRPLMQLAIGAAGFGLARWVGGSAGTAIAVLVVLALPASAAVLGVTGSAIEALNPLAIVRVIRGLGPYYAVILAATIVYALAGYGLAVLPVWEIVRFAAAAWLLLSLFSLIGGAIYERRAALGYEPQMSPERAAGRRERERLRRLDQMLDEVYVPARIREPARIVEPLRRWLESDSGTALEADARAILARAGSWDDPRAYALAAQTVIARLVAVRRHALALELFDGVRRARPDIAAAAPAELRALIDHARVTGRRRYAEQLEAEAGR